MTAAFTPPVHMPSVIELSRPRHGAVPTIVHSHGFRYFIHGNTLLAPALIDRALQSAGTPRDALASLLKTYSSKGYALVAVTGRVERDTVEIYVFEGIIVDQQAPPQLEAYFSGLMDRPDVNDATLIRDQIIAGTYASRSGQNISINLSPAPNPQGAVLQVTSSADPDYFPVSGSLNFGNYGSRFSSGYVAGANAAANLTNGIQISAGLLQGLPGLRVESFGSRYHQDEASASIVTPYGIYGLNATWTHFRLGQATIPLFPTGDITTYQVNGMQLVYADALTRVATNESFNHVKFLETVLSDLVTIVDQRYDYLSFGGIFERKLSTGARPGSLSAGVTFNIGISSPSGSLADNMSGVPTPHFKYADLTLAYQQMLPHGFQASVTAEAQASVSTLPSQQQWVLGGFGTLTAWEPGVLQGDSGYDTRLEIDAPSVAQGKSSLLLGGFLETGAAALKTPSDRTAPWQLLSDIGLSLKVQLPLQFSATAMTAMPLAEGGFNTDGRQALKRERLEAFFVMQKGF